MNTTAPSQQLAARERGATAGTTRAGGQSVFSSSTAPKGKSGTRSSAPATANAAPSARSATGDLWSGVRSAGTSPVLAAEATSAGQGAGAGTGVVAGVVILALGLTGLTGGVLDAARRRRAAAGSSSSRSTER